MEKIDENLQLQSDCVYIYMSHKGVNLMEKLAIGCEKDRDTGHIEK